MSWELWIIARQECKSSVRDTLAAAGQLCRSVLGDVSMSPMNLHGDLFDIESNTRSGSVSDGHWVWPSERYLWVTLQGVTGGIDIEVDHVNKDHLIFLEEDMKSRDVCSEKHSEMMRRAADGIRYTLRTRYGQGEVLFLLLHTISAILAEQSDGYLYTVGNDLLAPIVPLPGGILRSLLLDVEFRGKSGIEHEIAAAKIQLNATSQRAEQ